MKKRGGFQVISISIIKAHDWEQECSIHSFTRSFWQKQIRNPSGLA